MAIMSIDPIVVQWGLGFLGTGVLTGLGFILRTLGNQNKALAVLVERVGTSNVSALEARIASCETDLSRVWGIYDAWKAGVALPVHVGSTAAHDSAHN